MKGFRWQIIMSNNGKWMVASATIPGEYKTEFWNMWNWQAHENGYTKTVYREKLKEDGFSIKKDKFSDQWKINYFHEIVDDSFEREENGEQRWKNVFLKKISDWNRVLTSLPIQKKEKNNAEFKDLNTNRRMDAIKQPTITPDEFKDIVD